MRGLLRCGWATCAVTGCLMLVAVPAAAVPDCSPVPKAKVLLTDQGRLESIIGDARGRLYYTDLTDNRLLRLDGPGQQPRALAEEMMRPGGLVWRPGGTLIAGFSGGSLSGVPGNGQAGIFRVNPETGAKHAFVTGIDQANGMARGSDGSLYTSNDISNEIVRVRPNGSVQRHWADVESANGLTIDSAGRYLFVAQTFTPAKIARVELANPANATTWFSAPPDDTAAGLDGLARDGADRLYAAANGGGEIWRVTSGNHACALARGLTLPSNVAFGGGGSFPRRNLYVVTFGGRVVELANATDRPPATPPGSPGAPGGAKKPRLALSVRPRMTRTGALTRFEFTVTSRGHAVAGAVVRLAGDSSSTDSSGHASIAHRFDHPGTATVRVTRTGYRPASVPITVKRAGWVPTH